MKKSSAISRNVFLSEALAVAAGRRKAAGPDPSERSRTLQDFSPALLAELLAPLQRDPTIGIPILGTWARMFQARNFTVLYAWGTTEALSGLTGESPSPSRDPLEMAVWVIDVHPTTPSERSAFEKAEVPGYLPDMEWNAVPTARLSDPGLRKIPARLQRDIDALIGKGKTGTLADDERRELDELLDYLDDLTVRELELASNAVA